jgi:hypothetical protein
VSPPGDSGGDSDLLAFAIGPDAGFYAEGVWMWHTPFTFVFDFYVRAESPGSDAVTVPAERIVARVRLPIGLAFNLIRGVSDIMSAYETEWGEIHLPARESGGDW